MTRKLLLCIAMLFSAVTFAQTVTLVGGFQGWNLGTGVVFSTTDNVHYTLSNYTLPTNTDGIKIVVDNSWSNAYGFTTAPGFPSGTGNASLPNNNIVPPAGTYNIAFNATTKAYAFTAGVNPNAVINLTGSGISSTTNMTTADGISYLANSVTVTAGGVSFSQEGTANVWGNANFPSGTATMGGTAVATPAGGTFNVTFNKNTGAYSFTPTLVSIIGVGGPSGSWDVDAAMSSTDGIVYTLNNVAIVAGTMKFRDNSLWTFQFGSPGAAGSNAFPAGTAVQNGTDMATLSGTYNISFNRTTLAYNFAPALSVESIRKKSFAVSPNPSNDNWTITAESAIGTVTLYDITGKLVKSQQTASNELTIDTAGLSQGMYVAKVVSGSTMEMLKLVKN